MIGCMAEVSIKDLVKIYPASGKNPPFKAVKEIDLEVRDREFMVLVGPSGCGKSTTLRMIAGLEEITAGEISIAGRVVNDVQPKNRDIAMVFQNYALYPHMTVYDNMAFGLKLQKRPKQEIAKRVKEAADILGIESLLERKPKALSGGQRQRVAVGRAIVRNPKVFLFDEPLSNLDAKMRVSMRTEISKLHARLGATMIYVTHDQVEAMTMGDRICVMKDGDIMQVAEPLELYNAPANMFVAGFIGSPPMNFLHGTLQQEGGKTWFAEANTSGDPIRLELSDRLASLGVPYLGKPIVFGIRPEDIADANTIADPRASACSRAKVEVSEPMGAETFLYLDSGAHSFIAKVHSGDKYEINEGVNLAFDLEKAHLFDPESEKVLRQ
jgi:multiple sugar transport system ATP-binding protein